MRNLGGAVLALVAALGGAGCDRTAGDTAQRDTLVMVPDTLLATPRADDFLISPTGVGPIRLGATLDEARRAFPRASFTRTSDGDGVALVEVRIAPDTALLLWAGEPDAAAAVDWSRRISGIEALSAAFHTAEGVRPGSLVSDAEGMLGKVTEITLSEIESRQHVRFAAQPAGVTFRLDYTGVFGDGERTTTRYAAGAKILTISVWRPDSLVPVVSPPASDELSVLTRGLLIPVRGVVTSELRDSYADPRTGQLHEALDIMAPRGTPVLSATSGRLLKLFTSVRGGTMVYAADSSDRFILMYSHLDRYADGLVENMPLARGQLLGYVGSTGSASESAPHLHFGIVRGEPRVSWSKGVPVNPYLLFVPAALSKSP